MVDHFEQKKPPPSDDFFFLAILLPLFLDMYTRTVLVVLLWYGIWRWNYKGNMAQGRISQASAFSSNLRGVLLTLLPSIAKWQLLETKQCPHVKRCSLLYLKAEGEFFDL